MKAIIQKTRTLPNVFSASGIEIVDDEVFVIGDDSPFLYKINQNDIHTEKIHLANEFGFSRMPKGEKLDLETLSLLEYRGKRYLLTMGSGSIKEKRDKGYLIDTENFSTILLDLHPFYNHLRSSKHITGTSQLNIEGTACTQNEITLFVRGNVSGKNLTLTYSIEALVDHLLLNKNIPECTLNAFHLPSIFGWPSGFSGACYSYMFNKYIFTASVEKTTNEIDDGEIVGSFLGFLPDDNPITLEDYILIEDHDKLFQKKIESVAILSESKNTIKTVAVTDSDGGESELIYIDIYI